MSEDFEQRYYDATAQLNKQKALTKMFEDALSAVAWSTNLRTTASFRKYARAVLDAADVERLGSKGDEAK